MDDNNSNNGCIATSCLHKSTASIVEVAGNVSLALHRIYSVLLCYCIVCRFGCIAAEYARSPLYIYTANEISLIELGEKLPS